MQCPTCKKDVEAFYTCNTSSMQPFTAMEPREGMMAWGGLGVPRTVLCNDGEFVHFRFDRIGVEHLVRMVRYDPDAIEAAQTYNRDHPQHCEHEGCQADGIPCYLLPLDTVPTEWLCVEHAPEEGYCWCCGLFSVGDHVFDHHPDQVCSGCQALLDDEEIEFDSQSQRSSGTYATRS